MAATAATALQNPETPGALPEDLPSSMPVEVIRPATASIRRSEQLDKLFAALVEVQTELVDPDVDQSNPDFADHKYASLPSFLVPNRAILKKHNLAVLQTPDGDSLVTMLVHTSGQFIEGRTPLLLVSADMQGLGSAISYARRYGYQSILGLVQIDDDARRAVKAGATIGSSNATSPSSVTPIRPAQGSAPAPTCPTSPTSPARSSGFNVQATVAAIQKKTLIEELDVALTRVRSLFTGADLALLEQAIADRRSAIEATASAGIS